MKRRNFLNLSILSTFSVLNLNFTLKEPFEKSQKKWLADYLKLHKPTRNRQKHLSESQQKTLADVSKTYIQCHYKVFDDSVYISQNNLVLVPVALENNPANLFDINLLCFELKNDELVYQATLSSFDLEAISNGKIIQDESNLPIFKNPKLFKEKIKLQVKIQPNEVAVKMTYLDNDNKIVSNQYISEHCLINS